MNRSFGIATLLAISLLALARRTLAEEPDTARAELLFREGRAAERAGDLETACARFVESERILPAPGTSLNLALCDERAGHLVSARRRYLVLSESLPPSDARVETVKTRLSALESRVTRLELTRGKGAPGKLTVELDGAALTDDAFRTEHVLDPGTHVVVVHAEGRPDFRSEILLGEGERRALTVELSSPPPTKVRPPPVQPRKARRARGPRAPTSANDDSRTAGWVLLAAGGGAVAIGAAAGAVVLDRKATMDDHCNSDVACDDVGLEAASSGRTWSVVSSVAFGVGAASAGIGVYLLAGSGTKSSAQLKIRASGVSLVGEL